MYLSSEWTTAAAYLYRFLDLKIYVYIYYDIYMIQKKEISMCIWPCIYIMTQWGHYCFSLPVSQTLTLSNWINLIHGLKISLPQVMKLCVIWKELSLLMLKNLSNSPLDTKLHNYKNKIVDNISKLILIHGSSWSDLIKKQDFGITIINKKIGSMETLNLIHFL